MRSILQPPSLQRLWLPGTAPGLNEILDACVASTGLIKGHKRYNAYGQMKATWRDRVCMMARVQKLQPVECGYFTYLIREPNRRRDPSNIAAGAVKLIEDGLIEAGIIPNDGWACVLGYAPYWVVSDPRHVGVTVFITRRMVLDRADAIWRDEEARKQHGQA